MSRRAQELPALAESDAVGNSVQAARAEQKGPGWGHGLLLLCLGMAFGFFISAGAVVRRLSTELRWVMNYQEVGAPAAHDLLVDAASRTVELQSEAVDVPVPPDDRPYDYDFIIVIPAAAPELERRNTIRNSWAKYASSPHCDVCSRYKMRVVFVVGNEGNVTESRREAAEKGDMGVLEHFGQEELFTMNARKTLLSIQYAVQHFTFRHLLKCESDSWVYVDRLLDYFEAKQLWRNPILYAGNFKAGSGAFANQQKDTKWYDPIYPSITGFLRYPRHAKGTGYVLSRMLAEALASESGWAELPCEDVSVGFWLSAVRNEKIELPVSLYPACGETVLVDHDVSPDTMAERWRMYERCGSPCACERTGRGSRHGGREQTQIGTDR